MFKLVFMLLLTAHLLGDYYFQPQKLAQEKEKFFKKLCLHSAIYGTTCFAVMLTVMNKWLLLAAVFAALSHFIIDLGKWKYLNNGKARKTAKVYIADQSAHILCLFAVSIASAQHIGVLEVQSALKAILQLLNLGFVPLLSWLLALLLLWKPANVAIKKILYVYKPTETNNQAHRDDKRAGAFIGSLERLIMVLFLGIGQYAAIGLVLTAKSIARYDKISKDQEFAEYYLLGTLLSTAIVMVCYFAFLHY